MAPALPAIVTGSDSPELNLQHPLFSIYPNPTTGNFTLEQKSEKIYEKVRVEIYGMRGEKIITTELWEERKHEFRISDLQHGLYYVKVIADEYVETFKLVKTSH